MRRILGCLIIFFAISLILATFVSKKTFAADPTPSDTPLSVDSFSPTVAPAPPDQTTSTPDNVWIPDADVTFAGKSAARARNFLNWNLSNYGWANVDSSLSDYWVKVRNIVYALLLVVVFGASVIMILSHGTSLTVWQFVRKFIVIILAITFSFAIMHLIYQLTDIFQGFFIRNSNGSILSAKDLLNIAFKYENFEGFRLSGSQNDEAAFIATNLTKLTAITYYVMACILLVRKIILWFFIVISPIFPLLILYIPLRNTAKIWITEFLRWLLYAPLFMIFLSGLVALWKTGINVLPFAFDPKAPQIYPTAINILLGGPGQKVSINNNLNYDQTFIQYVVAIIMLWAVIFLPFLLLRIFLDYIATVSNDEDKFAYIKNSLNRISLGSNGFTNPPVVGKQYSRERPTVDREEIIRSVSSPVSVNPSRSGESFAGRINTNVSPVQSGSFRATPSAVTPKVNVTVTPTAGRQEVTPRERPSPSIPRLSDIARIEHAGRSSADISQIKHALGNIGVAQSSPDSQYRPMTIKTQVTTKDHEKESGDSTSKPLSHANIKLPELGKPITAPTQEEKPSQDLPETNSVQQVHPKDYTEVKNTWIKNFQGTVPDSKNRKDWIEDEKNQANMLIKLLMSGNIVEIEQAKEKISHLMPHLMLGGFSHTQVVGYLEAKAEAAEQVLNELAHPPKSK